MTRLLPLVQRGWALLLLPLSIIPFVVLGPRIAESHRNFDRTHKSGALPPPPVFPSSAEAARWQPLAPYAGAVPVVAYGDVGSESGLSRAAFARQMEMLSRAGFHTISVQQYARFRMGRPASLPSRPILITFDGGRLDTFRAADRVLQLHGFHAVMFTVTSEVERRNPDYLQWRELHEMERSGRWEVQPHAAAGRSHVNVDGLGNAGEFYAYRRFTASRGLETFADWQARVSRDLFDARDALVAQGFDPVSFAVPFGNYGQRASNDGRIAPWMRSLLTSQFGVVLVDDATRNRPPYTARTGEARRYVVRAGTTADDLYGWLRAAHPGARP